MTADAIWITGIGLVSPLGEGREAHAAAFASGATPPVESEAFAPFAHHPGPALVLDRQIPKKGDQRQMEPWQRLGTYAAGLAIDDAGARGLVSAMDLIVAAGGGERDVALDEQVLAALGPLPPAERGVKLNEMLASGLRPTLFLAQLSNLLAGNISVVHGVTGASRSFMGEEQAGADALRIAAARLAEGSAPIALAGGAYSAPRWDMIVMHHAGGLLRPGTPAPVFSRLDGPGALPGTQAGFLVLETATHARARGTRGLARLGAIVSARARRTQADRGIDAIAQAYARLAPRLGAGTLAVVSGCTGVAGVTELEREFLGGLSRPLAVRAAGNRFGWGVEATFPASIAMAALALSTGVLPAPLEALEAPHQGAPRDILVTGFGAWRGEALAHLAAIPEAEQP